MPFTFAALAAFAFVIGLTVLVHEFGHFAVAKLVGVTVYEFSVGMGPALLTSKRSGTRYSLRLFPLGGFVKLAGMDQPADPGEEVDADDPASFKSKPVLAQMAIIAAGPIMNFVLAVLVFAFVFTAQGIPYVQVYSVAEGGPAQEAGLRAGDIILSAAGRDVVFGSDVGETVRGRKDMPTEFVVLRGKETLHITVTPRARDQWQGGWIGVDLTRADIKRGILASFGHAVRYLVGIGRVLVSSVAQMISGKIEPEVAGPIGIMQLSGEVAKTGSFIELLFFAAFLSANLGLFNLVPIPVLDGGWLLLLAIEGLRGKPLSPQFESFARLAGLVFILLLLAFATASDITRIIRP